MHGVKPMNEEEKKPESVTAKQSNDKFAIVVSVFLILLIIGTAVANISGYVFRWEWVGVVDRKTGEIKTLWNWMDLLLVPFVLAAGAYLFNKSEKAHERKIAEQQRENERVLAAKRAKAELEISKDRQQQVALESYFDKMTALLLDKGLRTSGEDDEVRTIARTRTLTVLRGLDGNRRGQVLQFLYEAGLITGQNPIINLSFAYLRKIDLPYANLENVNLSKANLRKANLHTAKLMGANFYLADLDEADLSWADLRNANLESGLQKANLGVAKLDGARLFNANLGGAKLVNASLIGADLRHANLKYVNKLLGDSEKDNILRANLALANLSHCDLTDAKLDEFQLRGVKLEGAIMPNGTKFEEWLEEYRERESEKSS